MLDLLNQCFATEWNQQDIVSVHFVCVPPCATITTVTPFYWQTIASDEELWESYRKPFLDLLSTTVTLFIITITTILSTIESVESTNMTLVKVLIFLSTVHNTIILARVDLFHFQSQWTYYLLCVINGLRNKVALGQQIPQEIQQGLEAVITLTMTCFQLQKPNDNIKSCVPDITTRIQDLSGVLNQLPVSCEFTIIVVIIVSLDIAYHLI